MRNGKFVKKGAMSKTLVLVLSLILVIGCVTGGTLAWLLDTSDPVTNTFTDSDIGVHLEETTGETYKMVPGWTIAKDPIAWVDKTSEDCYLFVKVEETGVSFTKEGDMMPSMYAFSDFMTYDIAEGWTELTGAPGVYYRVCDAESEKGKTDAEDNNRYAILKDNKVDVLDTVTKEMMDVITEDTYPTLTFTAYASQMYKDNTTPFSAAEAWENVSGEKITTPDPETP